MRPLGVQAVVYPRRTTFHHLARGVMGYFFGPRDGPSLDGVGIRRDTGSAVRQYLYTVTPLTCLETHAALLQCANLSELAEACVDTVFAGDQSAKPTYERGESEVIDRGLNEVPPYENDSFIQQVKDI